MNTIINLTFHGIGQPQRTLSPSEQKVWVSKENFLAILDLVKDMPHVRITFDDGNDSDFYLALPALIERKLVAQFFVLAGYLEKLHYLNEQQVQSLFQNGMKIGSHGMEHCSWRAASNNDLNEELYVARDMLQDIIGEKIRSAACPFGAYDRRSLKLLKQAGYECVYTSDRGKANENDWLQARNTVSNNDDAESIAQLIDCTEKIFTNTIHKAKVLAKRLR